VKKSSTNILVLSLYILLTFYFLYGFFIDINTNVDDAGDSAHIAWILSWDYHQLKINPLEIFNANTFYPYKNTLAYSESHIGNIIFTFPLFQLTDNPVLVLNIIFIITFIISSFTTYLLVFYLTKNHLASFCSGIIYAFSPFRQSEGQITDLHVFSSEWIPLIFLYLHKYFDLRNYKYLFLFILFFILQSLMSAHYFAFLTVLLPIFLFYQIYFNNLFFNKKMVFFLFLSFIAILIILFPFFYPYYKFQSDFNFLFPLTQLNTYEIVDLPFLAGLLAIILSIFCFINLKISINFTKLIPYQNLIRILDLFIIFDLLIIILIIGWGGILLNVNFSESFTYILQLTRLEILFLYLFISIILRLVLSDQVSIGFPSIFPQKFRITNIKIDHNQKMYIILGLACIFIALGPDYIIYKIIYYINPLFHGIRSPKRIAGIFTLCISILAGYGINNLLSSIKENISNLKKYFIFYIIPLCLIIELTTAFYPDEKIPTPDNIPPVYKWLAGIDIKTPIVEFPSDINNIRTAMYTYFSSYHWKKMIHGYTGYYPPLSYIFNRLTSSFPDSISLKLLQSLGVEYIIVHPEYYPPGIWKQIIYSLNSKDEISLIHSFGNDLVYKLNPLPSKLNLEFEINLQNIYELGKDYDIEITARNNSSYPFIIAPCEHHLIEIHWINEKQKIFKYQNNYQLPPIINEWESIKIPFKLKIPINPGVYFLKITNATNCNILSYNFNNNIQILRPSY